MGWRKDAKSVSTLRIHPQHIEPKYLHITELTKAIRKKLNLLMQRQLGSVKSPLQPHD